MKTLLSLILLTTGSMTVACQTTHRSTAQGVTTRSGLSTDGVEVSDDLNVSQATLDKAWSLSQPSYYPYWWRESGCEARAFFQGATLAVNGIVAQQVDITALLKPQRNHVHRYREARW